MKRMILLFFVLTLMLSVPVLAQDMEPQTGGTLRAAWQSEWDGLDPHVASSLSTFQILNNVLETLTQYDDDLNLVPGLATSWEQSEDGLTWTFTLREGVQFSDGSDFTAEDVKWTFDRLLDPETGSGNASRVGPPGTVVNVVDDYTVEIVTPEPVGILPILIGTNKTTGIMSPASLDENGIVVIPIGTGPFMISELEGTSRVLLERNENYWQEGVPYLDAIEITPIPDDTVRETALRGGEVDWVIQVAPQSVDSLIEDPSIVVPIGTQPSYDYIGVNLTREPFDDVRVRQAISYALNREDICAAGFFGLCTPTQGPVYETSPWYTGYAPYERDIEKAQELLAEAGLADGFELELLPTTQFQETVRAAQVIQQNLAEIGIQSTINAPEWNEWLELEGNFNYDLYICSWNGLVDADDFYYLQQRTGQIFNFTGYSNPDFDALVDAGRLTSEFEDRSELYAEANQILVDDAPYIYMYNKQDFRAHADYVKGFVLRPDQANNFWNVWLDNQE